MSFQDFIGLLKGLPACWNTKRGLAIVWVVATAGFFLLPVAIDLKLFVRATVFFGPPLVFSVVWLFNKYWPRKKLWIVIVALESDPEADQYLNKALRGIQRRVSMVPTRCSVKFQRSHYENVLSRQDADTLINRGKANVVIWGTFTDANVNGEPTSTIDIGHYTHKLTPGMLRNLNKYHQDLMAVLDSREWQVRQKESLAGIIHLQSNFIESCLFILAVQMFTTGSAVEDSVVVFEFLLDCAGKSGNDDLAHRLQLFVMQAELLLARMAAGAKDWSVAQKHAIKLINLGVTGEEIDVILARAYYELGDEPNARACVDRMAERDPNSIVVLFDQAFFAILDKRYPHACSLYDRIHQMRQDNFVPEQIVEFFTDKMATKSYDPAYRYARGVIQLWYGDRKAGIADLENFQRLKPNSMIYESMLERASQLLEDAYRAKVKRQNRAKRNKRKK